MTEFLDNLVGMDNVWSFVARELKRQERMLEKLLRNKAKQDKLMQSPEFQTEYNQYLDELNRRGDGADNRD